MISIIIPTHNRANLIERAIKSVINQSYENWELIIVDDGSTDNTEQVVKPFTEDPRIYYYYKENSGAAHSRNVGVEKSTGKYITFLDSDDEAKEEWLINFEEKFENEDATVLCCGLEKYNFEGKLIKTAFPGDLGPLFSNLKGRFSNGGVFLMSKEIFIAIGGYDEELTSGQHTEMALRLIEYLNNKKISITNIHKALIKIHIHKGERIRTNFKAKYMGSKRTLDKHKSLFDKDLISKFQYQSVIAYNASKIGLREEALKYSYAAFRTKPGLKSFLRIFKYSI